MRVLVNLLEQDIKDYPPSPIENENNNFSDTLFQESVNQSSSAFLVKLQKIQLWTMDEQRDIKPTRKIVIEDPSVTINDIGGLETILQELQDMAKSTLEDQEDIQMLNGGVLLYGPPGCGKTVLIKAIANKIQANLIITKGPELLCESGET